MEVYPYLDGIDGLRDSASPLSVERHGVPGMSNAPSCLKEALPKSKCWYSTLTDHSWLNAYSTPPPAVQPQRVSLCSKLNVDAITGAFGCR